MIKPARNWILVKVEKITEKAGIVLPDTAQKEEEVVEVLAVGEDVEKIVVGNRVVAVPASGHSIPINGTESVFIKETDVIAIVEG
ncbi:MAG: co-chaperone GroES [Candidatus Omnitrophota bacterium]|nr:co-chaperone GroES [Candidatus Omnitrophota bacterium]